MLSRTCFVVLAVWLTVGQATAGVPPIITAQPQPQSAFIGASVNLRVAVIPSTGLRYRWRFNDTNLPSSFPGQFTPLLMITNATLASAGPYSVVVSNSFGAVTSQTAVVSINTPSSLPFPGFVTLSAVPGYSLFTTALGQYLTVHTVAQQIYTTADGASLFKLDGNGFIANNYLDGWSVPDMLLTLGEGWFFHNPTTTSISFTTVGRVLDGLLTNSLPAGYSLCTSLVPEQGLISRQGFFAAPGVEVIRFDSASQSFQIYTEADYEWQPFEPSIAVGEAFFIREPAPLDLIRVLNLGFGYPSNRGIRIVHPALASETAEINFFTYHTDPAFGLVLDLDGVTPVTNAFMGQLYAAPGNDEDALIALGRPVPFLNGAGAGYIRSDTIKLPGLTGGQSIVLQLRAWEKCAGDTYEQAVANGAATGRSAAFSAVARATIENGLPGLPPPAANAFPTFQVSLGLEVPLRVARIQSVGGTIEICFATRPGAVYCLQKAGTTGQPIAWAVLPGSEQILGTGHVATVSDTGGDQQAFYRVCRVQ